MKPGGYLCFTCIHFRNDINPNDINCDAWKYKQESDNWQLCVLSEIFSGWYPYDNMIIDIAKNIGFKLISKEETVNDYLQTSLIWRIKIRKAMSTLKGLDWCWYIWLYYLFNDPIFSYYCLAYHWGCTWTWQFEKHSNGKPSPCTHYTITFKKPQ